MTKDTEELKHRAEEAIKGYHPPPGSFQSFEAITGFYRCVYNSSKKMAQLIADQQAKIKELDQSYRAAVGLLNEKYDEILELRKLTQWQPIETMPDYSVLVLTWVGDWNNPRKRREIEIYNKESMRNAECHFRTAEGGAFEHTHWMPLPEPLVEEEEWK